MNHNELLELIMARQMREGMSSRAFAEKLGVSPALWIKTRTGDRRIGDALLKGLVAAYPDMLEVARQYGDARLGIIPLESEHEAVAA